MRGWHRDAERLEVPVAHASAVGDDAIGARRGCALSKDDAARRFFEGLTASQQKWHVQQVESAKTPETRQRRIGKSMEMLRQRQAR